ncbi:aminoacyl tRNA synthase complex-interacting multifunctional protein 1-like [Polyodon spathula]|uniref:aminoacyl tRNA synthase complex-interacting multifunctional protein 1-like n=1 Tax=Polyodon spathula TaxID=7913 RepID=UPI001B7E8F66|nr:aminoacyl tRNA synthase complex-interacting multifunctional protein 1-like [Polyodon spathula]
MFLARSLIKMSANNPVLNRLEQRTVEADEVIKYLKQQVLLLKEKAILQASIREEKKLRVENAKLKKDVEELKKQLIEKEKRNGVKQIAVPAAAAVQSSSKVLVSETVKPAASAAPAVLANKEKVQKENEDKKKKKEKKGENKKSTGGEDESMPVDVSRLDLRVGRIVTAKKHPDADSLYVEEVDLGEATPRTVVSGLVKHVPIEQVRAHSQSLHCKKIQMFQFTLMVVWVRYHYHGQEDCFLSRSWEGTPRHGPCPLWKLPKGPYIDTSRGEPDKELNPKKKVWEQIQPDLHTDGQCIATYKGAAFEVKGKGVCKAHTMSNSGIK